MLDAWLDAVVLLRIGPSLCAGAVLAGDVENSGGERVVATAYHCVASGLRPLVELRSGASAVGRVVARDPAHDLALVRVVLPAGTAGLELRAEAPTLGEPVWALGHPFGQASGGKLADLLVWSASRGVVSGVGPWLLQTDTALNPGNSGGPLVDEEGRLVGVVSRKIAGEGVGFAARADRVAELVEAPDPGPWLGGSWGAGGGIFMGDRVEVGAHLNLVLRERLVARGWIGLDLAGAEPFGRLTVEARQRVGRGPLSTTFDLGGGVRVREQGPTPLLTGRVGIAGLGFGVEVVPGTWAYTLTLDAEWPGTLGVF